MFWWIVLSIVFILLLFLAPSLVDLIKEQRRLDRAFKTYCRSADELYALAENHPAVSRLYMFSYYHYMKDFAHAVYKEGDYMEEDIRKAVDDKVMEYIKEDVDDYYREVA